MQETWVWSLGWKDPLEEGMATHSSILAWRIPWTEEPGGLQSKGSQRVGHEWVTERSTAPLSSYNKRGPLHFSGLQAVPCYIVTWLGLVVQTSGKPWFPLGIGTMQIPRSACAQQAWNLTEEVAWNPGGFIRVEASPVPGKRCCPGCLSSGSTQSQPWLSFLRTPCKMVLSSRVAVLMYKVWKRESSFSPRPATFCSPVGSMTCCQTVNDVLVLSLLLFWSCEACAVNTRCWKIKTYHQSPSSKQGGVGWFQLVLDFLEEFGLSSISLSWGWHY